MSKKDGIKITVAGKAGSGKTSLIILICNALREQGLTNITIEDPDFKALHEDANGYIMVHTAAKKLVGLTKANPAIRITSKQYVR